VWGAPPLSRKGLGGGANAHPTEPSLQEEMHESPHKGRNNDQLASEKPMQGSLVAGHDRRRHCVDSPKKLQTIHEQ
jgi:hypothetical protein